MCGIGVLLHCSGIEGEGTVDVDEAEKCVKSSDLLSALARRGPNAINTVHVDRNVQLFGAVLHIQGINITAQPLVDDKSGDALLWNGEVFGGSLEIPSGSSDTPVVMEHLVRLSLDAKETAMDFDTFASGVMELLRKIQGPFAFVYYSAAFRRILYGRDPFGRRSLIALMWGETVISVSSTSYFEVESDLFKWEEVPIKGIYSLSVDTPSINNLQTHTWPLSCLRLNRPITSIFAPDGGLADEVALSVSFHQRLQDALDRRVAQLSSSLLTSSSSIAKMTSSELAERCVVGVLFSGGIDSLLLAAILHTALRHAPASPIELFNVAFTCKDTQGTASVAPDRLAAIAGLLDLQRIYPTREWRLVEIDVTQEERDEHQGSIRQLIQPAETHMDLNIGTAFWFAARGWGHLRAYDAAAVEALLYSQRHEETASMPLLRLGQVQTTKVVPDAETTSDHIENAPSTKMFVDADTASEVEGTREETLKSEELTRTANGLCRRIGCTRRTKRACAASLCFECCVAKMSQHDSSLSLAQSKVYLCKVHQKESAKAAKKGIASTGVPASDKNNNKKNTEDDEEGGNAFAGVDASLLPVQHSSPYQAQCKALLVGIGADEQLAGYGRHRTTYQKGGLEALHAELDRDLTRLWQRNLGRDDRCVADHGREAWFPYLDEELVRFLQAQPLAHLVDLSLPQGVGDKRILRQTAAALGIHKGSQLVKRAIQFGSLASKQTSVNYYGSRRKGKGTSKI